MEMLQAYCTCSTKQRRRLRFIFRPLSRSSVSLDYVNSITSSQQAVTHIDIKCVFSDGTVISTAPWSEEDGPIVYPHFICSYVHQKNDITSNDVALPSRKSYNNWYEQTLPDASQLNITLERVTIIIPYGLKRPPIMTIFFWNFYKDMEVSRERPQGHPHTRVEITMTRVVHMWIFQNIQYMCRPSTDDVGHVVSMTLARTNKRKYPQLFVFKRSMANLSNGNLDFCQRFKKPSVHHDTQITTLVCLKN